jgi:hypothetical protein
VPLVAGHFAARDDFDAAYGRAFRLEADAHEWKQLLLFLRANLLAYYFEACGAQLITLAELVEKSFPRRAFYFTLHSFLLLVCPSNSSDLSLL